MVVGRFSMDGSMLMDYGVAHRNWKTIPGDSKEKYSLYLCSREWAVLREQVRKRCGGRCERCRVNPMDACHHLTYARKYNEHLSDLQGICNQCHDYTHGKSDYDPRSNWTDWQKYTFQFGDDAVPDSDVEVVSEHPATDVLRMLVHAGLESDTCRQRYERVTRLICDQFFEYDVIGWIRHGEPTP